jgi:hypothetical protein
MAIAAGVGVDEEDEARLMRPVVGTAGPFFSLIPGSRLTMPCCGVVHDGCQSVVDDS